MNGLNPIPPHILPPKKSQIFRFHRIYPKDLFHYIGQGGCKFLTLYNIIQTGRCPSMHEYRTFTLLKSIFNTRQAADLDSAFVGPGHPIRWREGYHCRSFPWFKAISFHIFSSNGVFHIFFIYYLSHQCLSALVLCTPYYVWPTLCILLKNILDVFLWLFFKPFFLWAVSLWYQTPSIRC